MTPVFYNETPLLSLSITQLLPILQPSVYCTEAFSVLGWVQSPELGNYQWSFTQKEGRGITGWACLKFCSWFPQSPDSTMVFRCQWQRYGILLTLLSFCPGRGSRFFKLQTICAYWSNKCQTFALRRKQIWTNKLADSLQPVFHLNTIWT